MVVTTDTGDVVTYTLPLTTMLAGIYSGVDVADEKASRDSRVLRAARAALGQNPARGAMKAPRGWGAGRGFQAKAGRIQGMDGQHDNQGTAT